MSCRCVRTALFAFGLFTLLPLAVNGVTTCNGSNIALPTKYLASMIEARQKGAQANNFVPSAYFLGQATKFVTTEAGVASIDDSRLCVDGNTRSEVIELFDDGTNGDDVAGDGVFSRACVHYCESFVDLNDIWGFAMETLQAAGAARLIVVDQSLEGQIPSETLPEVPQYPGASMVATSHAAFYVDSEREYFPEWPLNVEFGGDQNKDAPTGRSTAVGSLLATFGDVFDYVTFTGLEENFELGGAGIYIWQQWESSGQALTLDGVGEADPCTIAVTGVPVTRLRGVISTGDTTDSGNMNHELVHGVTGYSYHLKMGDRAIQGDNSHTPGTCTTDHSFLQGPIWDWEKGFPFAIPMGYCRNSDEEDCEAAEGDVARLEANPECDACPDGNLESCCTFRITDAIRTATEMEARPDLFTMTPLMNYIAGFLPIDQVPDDQKTFYCIGTNEDFECGSEHSGVPCILEVDESDRMQVKSNLAVRFTFDELVEANGPRFPPKRAVSTLRHGVVYVSQRVPSEAEMAFYTMFWRHWEVESAVHDRVLDPFDGRKLPLSTWTFETQGKSTLHSRLHGIPCGGGLSPPSCQDPQDESICAQASCSPGARCIPFDNLALCICENGLVGDGTACVQPSETVSYPMSSAHEIFAEDATECFGNNWPEFVSESSLPKYPGGVAPFAVDSPPNDGDGGTECFGETCAAGTICQEIPGEEQSCVKPNGKEKTIYHRFKKNGKCKERCRNDRPTNKWPNKGTCPKGQCVPVA